MSFTVLFKESVWVRWWMTQSLNQSSRVAPLQTYFPGEEAVWISSILNQQLQLHCLRDHEGQGRKGLPSQCFFPPSISYYSLASLSLSSIPRAQPTSNAVKLGRQILHMWEVTVQSTHSLLHFHFSYLGELKLLHPVISPYALWEDRLDPSHEKQMLE